VHRKSTSNPGKGWEVAGVQKVRGNGRRDQKQQQTARVIEEEQMGLEDGS
jgi:hypothetical protein